MNSHSNAQEHHDNRFMVGLLAGTVVGAGLVMWFAPRMAAELRQRIADSAKNLGQRASEQYRQASSGVSKAVDEVSRKGQGVRDEALGAVARGASEVERYASAAKSDHAAR